jgi:hypothetical protein
MGTCAVTAEVVDPGPVSAAITRAIATDARRRRVLTDPTGGQVLDAGAQRYHPTARLTEHIRTRDQHCRRPGCRQPAHRSEIDHTVAFDNGGHTVRINLAAMCKHHHRVKHLPGWTREQDPDGTLTFTSPHGQVHRTRPPTPQAEEPPVETVRATDPNQPPPF